MTKTYNAELLFMPDNEELRFLPEGPTALRPGVFSWVAIQHGPQSKTGSLNIYDMASGVNQSYPLPGRPGFAKPTFQNGTFIVGCERQLGFFHTSDSKWEVLADGIDADVENTIINDGTLYANNVVFGTKDLEFATPKAGLYLYRGKDGQLIRLRNDQTCSNGKDVIDLGKGGLQLIDIDTPTRKLVRYRLDIESGALVDEETIVDFSNSTGLPDGMVMTPDEQSVIVSFYNPDEAPHGETRQYSLYTGELEAVWQTPGSPQNTCPLLIEAPDGSVKLIITTAVEHMASGRRQGARNAGGIFIADTAFPTSPANPFFPLPKNRS